MVEKVKVGQNPKGGTLKTMYQSMNGSGSVKSSYFTRDAPSAFDSQRYMNRWSDQEG